MRIPGSKPWDPCPIPLQIPGLAPRAIHERAALRAGLKMVGKLVGDARDPRASAAPMAPASCLGSV